MSSSPDFLWVLVFGLAMGLCFIYVIIGTEDLILDLFAMFKGLKPKKIKHSELHLLTELPQKKIAILVPAWKEGEIIGQMLYGNLTQIRYDNYLFYVGCYPNDSGTIKAVQNVSQSDSRVIPLINNKPGPTSKGQMLNQILNGIRDSTEVLDIDAYLLHDSEDVIDPWALQLINYKLQRYDFIQIPVFSLNVNIHELVAGTYVDEFAESHTKDLLVRDYLGAAIPSAGVGTAFSAKLADSLYRKQGWVFYEDSLTEDYELGIRSHALKFKGTFACYWFQDPQSHRPHYIATREYFPKKVMRSIRQKTRWTTGISIQGWRNLGWCGSFINRYFLYRDRRGLATNILAFIGYPTAMLMALFYLNHSMQQLPLSKTELIFIGTALGFNSLLMLNRLVQRSACVFRVYGVRALWLLPIRWPLSVFVNSVACFNAILHSVTSRMRKEPVKWVKTDHELPLGFGVEPILSINIKAQERQAV